MPSSSVTLMPVELCEKSWPPTDDLGAVGERGLERAAGLLQRIRGRPEALTCVPTESWIGTSAADPSELRLAERGRVVRASSPR